MKRTSILFCLLLAITTNSFSAAKAQVNANDSLALVDLYNSTNGLHWKHHDNWLTTMPVSTWYGATVRNNRVTQLYLQKNNLSGPIPASIGNMEALDTLVAEINHLRGHIPPSIGNLSNLAYLDLDVNNLSGTIPSHIGNLTNLAYLSLRDNQLSGAIPTPIGNLTNLTHLDLSQNLLTGAIPAQISKLTNLVWLYLSYNQLSGSIPYSIGKLTNLGAIELEENQLSGTIPSSIGNIANLRELWLQDNQLSGIIPSSIGNLTNLNSLWLAGNQLSGTIPSSIGNIANLRKLWLEDNQLTGAIPLSLNKLQSAFINLLSNRLTKFADGYPTNETDNLNLNISDNLFTFNGLQVIAKHYPYVMYVPQDTILSIHQHGNTLSVSAGGTLSNNTYNWFKVGLANTTTRKADSTFTPSSGGSYYASVTNDVVKELTLHSDTIDYLMPDVQQNNDPIARAAQSATGINYMLIYPNPAKDIVHIQTNGTATIILTNSAGKILLTKDINNSGTINVSTFANGVYYIRNKTSGETQKIVIMH